MKKYLAILILAVASAAAFATPSPSQIESALAAHDYQSAKSMTEEVLRDKPESAKAHLFNAYVLLHTGNKAGANEELKTARRLDRSGGVANSALFGRTVAELEAPTAPQKAYMAPVSYAARTPVTTYQAPVQTSPEPSHWFFWTCLFCGVVGAALYYILREPRMKMIYKETQETYTPMPTYDHSSGISRLGVERNYQHTLPRTFHDAPLIPHQPVMAPQQQSMGMMGTAASVAGGVVAGNMISDMLHTGRHHRDSYDDSYESPRHSPSRYVEPEPTPSVDYESERSSYSSGSSDSWGSSSSSSSSDSWDSGSSSSSSSDSGGSWD